ncbi:MAG: hypothetical protein LBG67_00140 [Campylobacteraceae bacterium]|jgi:hypothetical protein|nr:hypothetical protein [Campylobacteraceae bacterium]
MRKYIVLFLLLFTVVFAQESDDIVDNIIEGSAGGDKIVSSQKMTQNVDVEPDYYYRREAIFSLNRLLAERERTGRMAEMATLVKVVAPPNVTIGNESNTNANNATVIVRGYCVNAADVYINKQPATLSMNCNTNIGFIEIFGNLQPVNEAAALIFQPTHIDFSGYRYKIQSFTTTNEARTSYNVATYVNDRKLAEIGYSTVIVANDEIGRSTSEYLKQLQESKKRENVEYVAVNSDVVPVTTTNTDKPNAMDYLITGGINIITSTIKTAAEVFRKDLPYLYEILGGSRIYVDLVVTKQGEKIE